MNMDAKNIVTINGVKITVKKLPVSWDIDKEVVARKPPNTNIANKNTKQYINGCVKYNMHINEVPDTIGAWDADIGSLYFIIVNIHIKLKKNGTATDIPPDMKVAQYLLLK